MKYNIINLKNQVHLFKACLLSGLCLAITVVVKPVYAADSQIREITDIKSLAPLKTSQDLTSNNVSITQDLETIKTINVSQSVMQPQLLAKVDTSRIMTASELLTLEVGQPIIIPLAPQQMAQSDSSGTVGDTFGEINKLRQDLLIEPIVEVTKTGGGAAPGSSAGTPSAYGASWKQAFIGAGFFFPFDGDVDGSLSLGFGLGDAVKSVGLEVSTNIISVGGQKPNFGDFADSGTMGFKLHKSLPDGTAVAFGWSNAIKWGEANTPRETLYGVITKRFDKLTVSLGVGSGGYRSKGGIKSGDNDPNLFAGLGYRFIPQASLVTSWTGSTWNLGASFVPLKSAPIVVNAIFTDVTDNVNGSGFSLSAGYSLQF